MSYRLKINRLLVLLQVILIPLYFWLLVWLGKVNIDLGRLLRRDPFEGHSTIEFLLMSVLLPFLFALPWILPALLNPNRIADTYALMGRALGKIRADLKFFYGLNAAFLMVFFILPFLSPALSIIGTVAFVSIFIHRKTGGHVPKGLLVLFGAVLAIFPLLGAISFYLDYVVLWNDFAGLWAHYLPVLYYIAICVANSIAYGDFFFLLKNKNLTNHSLRRQLAESRDLPLKYALLAVLLFILAATWSNGSSVIDIVNLGAIVVSILVGYLKWRRRLGEGGAGGLFIMFVFMVVNIIREYFHNAMSVVIILSGALFISLFVLAYLAAGDEEFTP